jgi:flagellar motor switch protein FliN/FliY
MSDETDNLAKPGTKTVEDPGAAISEANEAMSGNDQDPTVDGPAGQSVDLKDLSEQQAGMGADEDENIERTGGELEAVFDIPVNVSAVLGKSHLQVSQLLKLGRGAIVELDRKVGEAIDIYVNDRLVARGEVVLVDDRLGVTMTEIVKGEI